MKALIKKDIRLLTTNMKLSVFLLLGILILPNLIFGFDTVAVFISYILFILLYFVQAIDDKTKFEEYALTLPVTRAGYVRIKYIELAMVFIISVGILLFAEVILITSGQMGMFNRFHFDNLFSSELREAFGRPIVVLIVPAGLTILFSLFYPVIFKLGIQAGQAILIVVLVLIPLGAGQLMNRVIDLVYRIIDAKEKMQLKGINTAEADYGIPHIWGFVLLAITIVVFLSSYALSRRIVKTRDF